MKKCVICNTLLNSQNKSKEHIIHNAIGGSLENDEIYCKSCNAQYGSNQDKAFTQIFAPFVAEINMHKTRKTKGTSYTGIMCDQSGNCYTATYKDGKVMKLENNNSKYIEYEEGKYKTLYHHFKLDNDVFKNGISKIAFNYAIDCGLQASCLERVFDYSKKKLINNPIIIPFVPLTSFDCIMEKHSVEKIYHAVRIFNCENFLYAYIELFNTFQHYVLLSEKYNFEEYGDIDKSYGNIIEANDPLDKDLLKSITPKDYKDADIIRCQYGIDTDKLLDDLKKYHNYNNLNKSQQVTMLFAQMGKIAYEQVRKQSYIKEYKELLKNHYDAIDFSKACTFSNDIETIGQFYHDFKFYTIYEDDCIDIERYKRILPDSTDYPIAISKILNINQNSKDYAHMKFHMLEKRFAIL